MVDRTVLATCVQRLQHDKDAVVSGGVVHLLKLAESCSQLTQQLLTGASHQSPGLRGVVVSQTDSLSRLHSVCVYHGYLPPNAYYDHTYGSPSLGRCRGRAFTVQQT